MMVEVIAVQQVSSSWRLAKGAYTGTGHCLIQCKLLSSHSCIGGGMSAEAPALARAARCAHSARFTFCAWSGGRMAPQRSSFEAAEDTGMLRDAEKLKRASNADHIMAEEGSWRCRWAGCRPLGPHRSHDFVVTGIPVRYVVWRQERLEGSPGWSYFRYRWRTSSRRGITLP